MTGRREGKAVGIVDVAARAGVSVGTVSNVLNRPERVSEPTRERVLAAIDEVGFVRNGSASRLRLLQNRALGLVVVDIGNEFYTEVVRGAQHAAEDHKYAIFLCDDDSSLTRELDNLRFLEEQRVAGILIAPSKQPAVGVRIDELRERGIRVVLVDEPAADPDVCSVSVDDVRGGQMVGEHLLQLGRQRIVYVTVEEPFRPFEERLIGLELAVAAHADAARIDTVTLPTLTSQHGYRATESIVDHEPDAIFCANDRAAVGVMRGLLEAGVDIPGEVALIGYDDTDLASMMPVPLSSVRQPARIVGSTSAALLIEECADAGHVHQHVLFQPALIARASTIGAQVLST